MEPTLSSPTPTEHGAWLRSRRRQLQKLLAGPAAPPLLHGASLGSRQFDDYQAEQVVYEGEEKERITAALLVPRNHPLPLPAIVCLHSQGPDRRVGKRELIGPEGIAAELCRRGYVVLAPEAIGYEERRETNCEMEAGRLLLQGWSLPGKLAWEVSRAVDYLAERTEVERGRVGLLGLGKGGLLGWLATAVEPRLKAAVICWGTSTYASLLAQNSTLGPIGWIPGLLNWGDVPEVCSLIAPRPLSFCAAQNDPLFPFTGFQEVYWRVRQLYSRLGEEQKLDQYVSQQPRFDDESRARVRNWFDRWL